MRNVVVYSSMISNNEPSFSHSTSKSACKWENFNISGKVRNHSLKELQKFRAELESDYKQLIDSATENLTKICKEEKKTWTYHDQVQDRYDEMIKEVEERTEQQVCCSFTVNQPDPSVSSVWL